MLVEGSEEEFARLGYIQRSETHIVKYQGINFHIGIVIAGSKMEDMLEP